MKVFVGTDKDDLVLSTTAKTRRDCWFNIIYGEFDPDYWEMNMRHEKRRKKCYNQGWRVNKYNLDLVQIHDSKN